MNITKTQLNQFRDFIADTDYDEWLIEHADIKFYDQSKTIVIIIDNINEQEYDWLKIE